MYCQLQNLDIPKSVLQSFKKVHSASCASTPAKLSQVRVCPANRMRCKSFASFACPDRSSFRSSSVCDRKFCGRLSSTTLLAEDKERFRFLPAFDLSSALIVGFGFLIVVRLQIEFAVNTIWGTSKRCSEGIILWERKSSRLQAFFLIQWMETITSW